MIRPEIDKWKDRCNNGSYKIDHFIIEIIEYAEFLESRESDLLIEIGKVLENQKPNFIETRLKVLSNELYSHALFICGYHGQGTNTAHSVTSENYIEYKKIYVGCKEEHDIEGDWKAWVCAYYNYVNGKFYDGEELNKYPTLYWRLKPEIVVRDGNYEVYARLLISKREGDNFGTRSSEQV